MRARSVGIVGAAIGAALGLGAFACESTTQVQGPTERGLGDETPDGGSGVQDNGSVEAGTPDAKGGSGDGDAGIFIACESPSPVIVAGVDTGFVQCAPSSGMGVRHRVKVVTCPSALPRASGGTCTGTVLGIDAGTGCSKDSDCTAKALGTCDLGDGHFPSCACSYGCTTDADCATGQICECADPVGRCVTAKCSVDSACAAGSLCASAATSWGGCSWDTLPSSYVCQTGQDTCLTSKQCPESSPACAYDSDAGARSCHQAQLACPGRPFLVDGAMRVAPVVSRRDWSARGVKPSIDGLAASTRAELASYWTRVAQLEHASVAAFARFTLELLALGAPADLIVSSQQAMADETEHARLAFGLASAYAGKEVGPGRLAMQGALPAVTVEATLSTLLREGCIGETLAAVEATEALAQATDPAVREVLARIARDETKHAELSWRAARWLIDAGDEGLRAWASEEVDQAIVERQAARSSGGAVLLSPPLTEHGMLDASTVATLAEDALRDLVTPCARLLRETQLS
jgi:hypothetical protein